jgi:nitroreductase
VPLKIDEEVFLMDMYDAIRNRRSIRRYQLRNVEDDRLRRVLEAGLAAPSASNRQPWRFIVVRDPEKRKALAEAAKGQRFVGEAPVVIAACGVTPDYIMTCGQPAYSVDVSIAVDHMTLAAVAEGLGTCWIGAFHEDRAKVILGVPDDVRIVALLPLGYPAHDPSPTPRKPYESRVCHESWSETWGD